jgi:hypothetical protein
MADPIDMADEKHAEANRLYWEDARSVDEVAAALGMSRSALYAAVVPHPAEAACTACGAETVYPNRRHRSHGVVRCTSCGAEEAREGSSALDDDVFNAVLAGKPHTVRGPGGGLGQWKRDLAEVDWSRKGLIGGGAALGLLAGLVVGAAFRRR